MYCELADLKAYIPNINGTSADSLLTDCIARAQAAIDRYCGRTFEAETDTTRYFDTLRDVEGVTLYLDHDLCQITSIVNAGTTLDPSDYVTVPRNETPWFAIKLRLTAAQCLWTFETDSVDAIEVAGRWSYSIEAPDDIVQACIRLASYYYKMRDSQVFDVTADPQKGTITIPKGIPQDVKVLLEPYRRLA